MSGRGEVPGESYEQLFRQQFPGLVRLAGLLGTDDPENVTQEAFVRLHGAFPRLRDRAAALAYVRRTVVTSALPAPGTVRLLPAGNPPCWRRAQSLPKTSSFAGTIPARCSPLDRLSRHHREVLVLRYWSELSVEEAARALDVSTGTVKSRTARALSALADLLGRHDDQPGNPSAFSARSRCRSD